jgi:hypothetical protein
MLQLEHPVRVVEGLFLVDGLQLQRGDLGRQSGSLASGSGSENSPVHHPLRRSALVTWFPARRFP